MGASKSGLSLVAGILNCLRESSIVNPSIVSWVLMNGTSVALSEFEHGSIPIHLVPITYGMYKDDDLHLLDNLNHLFRSIEDTKYIWVMRDPRVSCSCIMNRFGLSSYEVMKYWHDVNCILWYFFSCSPGYRLKYEDILMSEKSLKGLFEFLEVTYDSQYRNYGDFEQPRMGSTFNKGYLDLEMIDPYDKTDIIEAWNLYKDRDIFSATGYYRN